MAGNFLDSPTVSSRPNAYRRLSKMSFEDLVSVEIFSALVYSAAHETQAISGRWLYQGASHPEQATRVDKMSPTGSAEI